MLLKNYYRLSLLLCFLLFFLASCNLVPPVTVNGTPVITTGNSTPDTSGPPQLNVWSKVAPGVELRYEDWKSPAGDADTVAIVRFDLHHVRLSVEYQPAHPRFMSDWIHKEQATAIIRGLRALSDFEFEFNMALMNRHLEPKVETIFVMPKESYSYTSSSLVKQIAKLGGDVSKFVPGNVAKALRKAYAK